MSKKYNPFNAICTYPCCSPSKNAIWINEGCVCKCHDK